jgi:hypothetical protein
MPLFLLPVKFILFILIFFSVTASAQTPQDTVTAPPPGQVRADTARPVKRTQTSRPRRQVADTTTRDTMQPIADSVIIDTLPPSIPPLDSIKVSLKASINSDSAKYLNRFYFRYTKPIRYSVTRRQWQVKEEIFYTTMALILFFAFIKNSFRRYLGDLFKVFFRNSFRQKQIKDQLLQNPLPSLLFNIFFVLSTGIFLALIFQHFNFGKQLNFLLLSLYLAIGLALVYVGKFIMLKLFGWVFQSPEASDTYIFVVFTANKVIGIVVLPFLVLLAFTYGYLYQSAVALSLITVIAVFIYRYFLAYVSVSRYLKINFFHFLLYLLAFEVMPLLLINKLLFLVFAELH